MLRNRALLAGILALCSLGSIAAFVGWEPLAVAATAPLPASVAPTHAATSEPARAEPALLVEPEEQFEPRQAIALPFSELAVARASRRLGEPTLCSEPRAHDPIFDRFPDREPGDIAPPVRGCRRAGELPLARKGPARDPSESAAERAVRVGLEWLSDQQACDGRWSSNDFLRVDARGHFCVCEAPAPAGGDIGATGLALLALLGDGNTTRHGPHKVSVSRGVQWLREQQDEDSGLIGSRLDQRFACEHAIATLAITEAYYFSKNPLIKTTAQDAIDCILRERDPISDWWRGVPSDRAGDEESEWASLALARAEESGLSVGAVEPQRRAAEGHGQIRCETQRTELPGTALDALNARARREHLDPVHARDMEQRLLSVQRLDGDAAGSWNPSIVPGGTGARVESTALALLTLEACVYSARASTAGARRPR